MFSAIRQFFQKKRRLQPLIANWQIPKPEFLWLANQSIPKKIPVQEIEAILNMTWTEVVLGTAATIKKVMPNLEKNLDEHVHIIREEYIKRQNEITENCVIRWLDDQIGWVLTLRPGKSIDAGFLTCYAGEMTSDPRDTQSSYAMREYYFGLYKTEREDVVINAKNFGNWARLLPFLLEEEYLDNFDIDPDIKNKIALANLKFQFCFIEGIKLPCVYVPQKITAPDDKELLLGLNYSLQYLCKMTQQNKIFKLINKDTLKQLDSNLYKQKIIQIHLEGMQYSFELSRFRIMLAKTFPQLQFRTVGCDEENKEYYEITVSDAEIYDAFMADPETKILTIKPIIKQISYAEFNSRQKNANK